MTVMNTEKRINFINDLNDFISKSSQKVSEFRHKLNWSLENVSIACSGPLASPSSQEHFVSSMGTGHDIPLDKLESHTKHDQWHARQEDNSEDDVPFPQCYTGGGPTISLTQESQADIIQAAAAIDPSIPSVSHATAPKVPQSASQLVTLLTPRQRLALYEYAVRETSATAIPVPQLSEQDMAFEIDQPKVDGPKSFLEVLADQRDSKRRRLNYRQAKKVHTQHKSQNEVTREVIQNQMEMYNDWVQHRHDEHTSGSGGSLGSESVGEDGTTPEICTLRSRDKKESRTSHHSDTHRKQKIYPEREFKIEEHKISHSSRNYKNNNYRQREEPCYEQTRSTSTSHYREKHRERKRTSSSHKVPDDSYVEDSLEKEKHKKSKKRHSNKKRHRSSSAGHHKHSKRTKHIEK